MSMTLYGNVERPRTCRPGKKLFADNCAVCHGDAGQGDREKGGPRLASHVHLYGDDRAAVVAQITKPRMGVMPDWNTRLDEATIKSVALTFIPWAGGEVSTLPVRSGRMSRISKADRQLQLEREEAGDHLYANRVRVYPKSVHGPVRTSNGRC